MTARHCHFDRSPQGTERRNLFHKSFAKQFLVPSSKNKPLLADDFYEDALFAFAVEFAIEDLLPGTEIELAAGDGNDHLPAHDAALEVRVGVVLEAVVPIL